SLLGITVSGDMTFVFDTVAHPIAEQVAHVVEAEQERTVRLTGRPSGLRACIRRDRQPALARRRTDHDGVGWPTAHSEQGSEQPPCRPAGAACEPVFGAPGGPRPPGGVLTTTGSDGRQPIPGRAANSPAIRNRPSNG